MVLEAISIGYAIPGTNFDSSVHSVFQSAVNLQPTDGRRLLSLVASSEADLPQGIRLDVPKDFFFDSFKPGDPAVCKGGILYFENTHLIIQLSSARRWKCDLPAMKADITNPAMAIAWNFAWDALNKRQKLLKAEIIAEELFCLDGITQVGMSRKIGEGVHELVRATRRNDLTVATAAVSALIGLGTGLTPSGDDFLVGYLAGLWCTVQDRSERVQFIYSLGKSVIRLSKQTNDISRTYLYYASIGQISSRMVELAEAISRGENPERLLEVAEAAMSVGHTSGMDAVTGLLVGFTAFGLAKEIPHSNHENSAVHF